MKQSHPAIRCDVDQIPENQRSWSEKPSSVNMDQVRELLDLMRGIKMNVVVVAVSFIVRCTQPYMERVHSGFDFKGDTDGTQEMMERLTKVAMLH